MDHSSLQPNIGAPAVALPLSPVPPGANDQVKPDHVRDADVYSTQMTRAFESGVASTEDQLSEAQKYTLDIHDRYRNQPLMTNLNMPPNAPLYMVQFGQLLQNIATQVNAISIQLNNSIAEVGSPDFPNGGALVQQMNLVHSALAPVGTPGLPNGGTLVQQMNLVHTALAPVGTPGFPNGGALVQQMNQVQSAVAPVGSPGFPNGGALVQQMNTLTTQVTYLNITTIRLQNEKLGDGLSQPFVQMPFVNGQMPPADLPQLRDVSTILALNSADANSYLQGFGLGTAGNLPVRRRRIAAFIGASHYV